MEKKRKRVTFTLDAEAGSEVFLAGSFNDWNVEKKPMTYSEKEEKFTATLMLTPGTYEYKFCIDGNWCADTDNNKFVTNNLGSINSVVEVEES